ncbi:MFS transporter [Thermoactinospora rubra]|uniref:MFS transporter n=1 Tax=Thermoactinospora rubra TaxID=1088767 RepID=UPI000A10DCB0|nr:MFS transporter [Thermoactinospora rubra]
MAGLPLRLAGLPDIPAVRRWAWGAVVDSLGTGLMLPLGIIYFTQVVKLPPVMVGLAMSVAGITGVALVPVVGALVDRLGVKPTAITAFACAAAGTAGYLVVDGVALLIPAVVLAQLADTAGRPVKQAFMAQIAEGEARSKLMAFNRSVRNAGYGVGGLLAAGVLAIGTREAYLVAIALDALTFATAAVLVATIAVPAVRPPAKDDAEAGTGYREVLADWRYVCLAGLNGVVLLHAHAFLVGMPLWLVEHTSVPQAMAGVLFTANTVMVVLFQVRAAKGLAGPADVGPTYRRAALAFAAAAGAYILAHFTSVAVAIAAMAVAVVMHTIAELLASAGEWTVCTGLAPERLRGRYLAVYALGDAAEKAIGSLLITFLLTNAGWAGWLVLSLLVSGAALLSGRLAVRHPRLKPVEVSG